MSHDSRRFPHLSRLETLRLEPRSHHAQARQQQRATGDEAVDAALRWGLMIRQAHHRIAYFLGKKSVQQAARAGESIERHLGTTVVQAADSTLVTVIRSQNCRKLRRMAR